MSIDLPHARVSDIDQYLVDKVPYPFNLVFLSMQYESGKLTSELLVHIATHERNVS